MVESSFFSLDSLLTPNKLKCACARDTFTYVHHGRGEEKNVKKEQITGWFSLPLLSLSLSPPFFLFPSYVQSAVRVVRSLSLSLSFSIHRARLPTTIEQLFKMEGEEGGRRMSARVCTSASNIIHA